MMHFTQPHYSTTLDRTFTANIKAYSYAETDNKFGLLTLDNSTPDADLMTTSDVGQPIRCGDYVAYIFEMIDGHTAILARCPDFPIVDALCEMCRWAEDPLCITHFEPNPDVYGEIVVPEGEEWPDEIL